MPKERKELIKQFIAQNEISSAKDIEEALKNMFKDTLQELLEAELDEGLGYEKYEYSDEPKDNYRNGYSKKIVYSSAGDIELSVPRDRNGEFDPTIVEKDISEIEEKIIPQIKEWQTRPLDEVYPVVFVDATYTRIERN